MSVDSENSFLKQIFTTEIPNPINLSQFNKRRRKLFLFSEEVKVKLTLFYQKFEDYYIVDSMP